MGTLTVQATGFAPLPATPPANWPANVTYPAGQTVNGANTVTINDTDWQALITWAAASFIPPPAAPTGVQILLAYVKNWHQGFQNAIQQYNTSAVVIPPPITLT